MKTFPINSSQTAVALFGRKFNCAQSVFAAFSSQLGMDESRMLKLASPLGGGIARRGQVCGAVTGALLALGLARGSDTPDGKEAAYRLGQEFLQRFETRHGTLLCRELLGCDISTEPGRRQAQDNNLFTTLCPQFVGDAAEIVQSMLGSVTWVPLGDGDC
jgi:C_GCAxxG_C_C family probable redox protein